MISYDLMESELESALKLATMWGFEDVRRSAISSFEATTLTPTRALQLAHLYNIDHWLATEIQRLVFRRESLTLEEAEQIGLEMTVEVYAHREKLSRLSIGMMDATQRNLSSEDVEKVRALVANDIEQRRIRTAVEDLSAEPSDHSLTTQSIEDFEAHSQLSNTCERDEAETQPTTIDMQMLSMPYDPLFYKWENTHFKFPTTIRETYANCVSLCPCLPSMCL